MCGHPPEPLLLLLAQTFCFNDECPVLAWDAYSSAAENLADATEAVVTNEPLPAD
jgi:hypothetical protein